MSWKEVLEIRSQIAQMEARKRDALTRLDDAALRHLGLSIGDRIIVTNGRGMDFECMVTGADGVSYSSTLRPTAVKVKKNGAIGSQSAGYIEKWRKKDAAE
jgi:hypothetical protein